jgi:TusA-related sulfurtransferase
MMETIEIDIRGQLCPATLLVALREINARADQLRQGAVKLCFLIDNRDATGTIPESAANMGYAATVEKNEGWYRVEVTALH